MNKNAIIMLNWNGSSDTVSAIKSLIDTGCLADIFVIDNGSCLSDVDKLKQALNKYSFATIAIEEFVTQYLDVNVAKCDKYLVLSDKNLGFAGANNHISAIIARSYDSVTLLNNDVEVESGFIDEMYRTLIDKKLTAVTCDIRYYYDKNLLWNDGGKFTWYGDRKYFTQKKVDKLIASDVTYINAEFITGCCLMIASSYIIENGLFTDKFFHGEEDFNLCRRLKCDGLKVGVTLRTKIYHKVGQALNFDKDDIRTINKTIIHYTNRIINMREFYGKCRWKAWRIMYITMFSFKYLLTNRSINNTLYITKNVAYFSKIFNDVKFDNYTTIMNNKAE